MGYSDLLSKAEAAAKVVVDTLTFSATHTVNTGLDDDNLTVPCVICAAEDAGEEAPVESGNFWVTLQIQKVSNANDTSLANHRADLAILVDKFMEPRETVEGYLSSAVSDFHVQGIRNRVPVRDRVKTEGGDLMIEGVRLDILACASDIS